MKIQKVKLAKIIPAAGIQVRVAIDPDLVSEYAEAMRDPANQFPPIVVFDSGDGNLRIVDGFHRVAAANENDFLDILAEVREDSRIDALKFALLANTTHGLRRSNEDKRHAVELAIAEWGHA